MSDRLRWLLLTWRYLAVVILAPLVVAMLMAALLPGIAMPDLGGLALIWAGFVLAVMGQWGDQRRGADLLALGLAVGLVAALWSGARALPVLLMPLGLLIGVAAGIGFWLLLRRYPPVTARLRSFGQGKRRAMSAAICSDLPAGKVFDAFRLAPEHETPLYRCGTARDDGWFEVESTLLQPHLPFLADDAPAPSRLYARIMNESRFEQTLAFSDGDGVSLTVQRLSVTPQRSGCVLRECGTTNTLGLLDWIGWQLQNAPLWSLATRLDHFGAQGYRYGAPVAQPDPLAALKSWAQPLIEDLAPRLQARATRLARRGLRKPLGLGGVSRAR